jgi:hypothetical protein
MVCLEFLASNRLGKSKESISGKQGVHRVNYLTPHDWVIMRMMVDGGYLRFIASKPSVGPDILHVSKVVSLVKVKGSICEQRNLQILGKLSSA